MTNRPDENDIAKVAVAITDFLRDQFIIRYDIDLQNRCNLEIAAQCVEKAYGIVGSSSFQHRFSRPSIDIFNQMTYPVSIKDKILADAHNEDGNNYMRRNMAISAEVEYTIAIEMDKWNSIYYCNRASSRIEQSRFAVAIADCKQALALNPDYAKAYARMGQAFSLTSSEDLYEEAVRCFRKALELDPGSERYKHNLRVAEAHVKRSAPPQITTGFVIGPPIYGNGNSGILPSTSFAVIDEAGRPISDTFQTTENAQISQDFRTVEQDKQTNKNSMTTFDDCSSIALPTAGSEKYKHNLLVAEAHVKRPAPPQITTGFGIGPPIYGNDNSGILPSTSFAVTDEAGCPISDTFQTTENAQISQDFLKVEQDKQTNKNSMTTSDDCSSIALPTSANKETEQETKFKIKQTSKKKDDTKSLISEELVINTPLSTHNIAFVPESQPFSSYADGSGSNVEVMNMKAAAKLQNNVSTLPMHKTEVKSENIENIHMPLLEDFSVGSKSLQDCADELQLNNQEENGASQVCVNDVKSKAKHAERGKEEIANMPPSKDFKKEVKLSGVSTQKYNKPSSSLIRQKNNSRSEKYTTGAHAGKIKEKTAEAINKDVKQEKTELPALKDSSRNKQENREISSSNKNSAINKETSCAKISQNNSNNIEYYFAVMQCALMLCSALFYFKMRHQ